MSSVQCHVEAMQLKNHDCDLEYLTRSVIYRCLFKYEMGTKMIQYVMQFHADFECLTSTFIIYSHWEISTYDEYDPVTSNQSRYGPLMC